MQPDTYSFRQRMPFFETIPKSKIPYGEINFL
jgi:hypothetical protein